MPDVVVTGPAPLPSVVKGRIVTDTGTEVVLSWVDVGTTLDNLATGWAKLGRPGRKPITVPIGPGLKTVSLSAIIGSTDRQLSAQPALDALLKMARDGARVRVVYGGLEAGWWRITACSIQSQVRAQGTNDVSRAVVSVAFTEDVPGGPVVRVTSVWRFHVWAGGDTMQKLATLYLGSSSRWKEILAANKLTKNPPVGTRLRIPPR